MAANPIFSWDIGSLDPPKSAATVVVAATASPVAASPMTLSASAGVATPVSSLTSHPAALTLATGSNVVGPPQKDKLVSAITSPLTSTLIDFSHISPQPIALGVTANFDVTLGKLSVWGTSGDDSIKVVQYNGSVSVFAPSANNFLGPQAIDIRINGGTVKSIAADILKSISVDGGNGNDRLRYEYTTTNPFLGGLSLNAAKVSTLTPDFDSRQLMGAGGLFDLSALRKGAMVEQERAFAVELYGGIGNDALEVTGESAAKLYGGAGADLLSGGNGADLLSGGSGDDVLHGNGGADSVYGDDVTDRWGGTGNDKLYGGGGNDML
jgi:hypothetical protein